MGRVYRVGELAALTGVSIRTLHHYDRIGLLRPSAYSEGGHRLYSERDLLSLQQILTLRYLGFPLKQIGALLRRPDFDLVASMQIQRGVLRGRIAELERIEAVVGALLEHRLARGRWDWDLVAKASAAVQDRLAQKGEDMNQYYTPDQMKQFEELARQAGPDAIRRVEHEWATLLMDVQAACDRLDPASLEAQTLADRWNALIQATFRGNQELMAAVGQHYRQGRFADQPGTPRPEDFAFIASVHAARRAEKG